MPVPKGPFDRAIADAEFGVIREALQIARRSWMADGEREKARVARALLDYLLVPDAKMITTRPARLGRARKRVLVPAAQKT